jgi:undecaprenyl-diphosphatase
MNNQNFSSQEEARKTSLSFRFFGLFQHSGDSILLFPLFLLLFFTGSGQLKMWAGVILAGITLTGLVVFVLKQVFRKERPDGTAGKMYRKYDRFSLPSGHAARAWTIAMTTAFFYWPLAIALSVWAALISYSRLKLNLHDVTDVVAGTLVGIVTGLIVAWIFFSMIF